MKQTQNIRSKATLILQLAALAILFQVVAATTPSNSGQARPVAASIEQPVPDVEA